MTPGIGLRCIGQVHKRHNRQARLPPPEKNEAYSWKTAEKNVTPFPMQRAQQRLRPAPRAALHGDSLRTPSTPEPIVRIASRRYGGIAQIH